jgi:hypothetical protein
LEPAVLSTFDFSLFSTAGGGQSAFAWSFKDANNDGTAEPAELVENWLTYTAPSQYNACLDTFRGGTFDNEVDEWDPLSGEVYLGNGNGGDGLVAFYFLTAALRDSCQAQAWTLFITEPGSQEEVLMTSAGPGGPGIVNFFAEGKYLWFKLTGIPAGSTLRLAVEESPDNLACNGNSHLSAIYVSGTNACNLQCAPDYSVDKTTLADGLDVGDFAEVGTGAAISWLYTIKNVNPEPVTFSLYDNPEGLVGVGNCGSTTLAAAGEAGDSTTCTLDTGHVAPAGPYVYENQATVVFTAERDALLSVECTDTSGYIVPETQPDPPICGADAVVKETWANGADISGGEVEVGTPVTWKYHVTNNNAYTVSFDLSDNPEGTVTCGDTELAGGGATDCELTGTAELGPYENTATVVFTTTDGSGLSSPACGATSSYTGVKAPPENPGTGTLGYWKTHANAWPVETITIGGIAYAKADAIGWMKKPTAQDKTIGMFQQLVAAKLNVLIGNDASCIADTIAAADAWMTSHPVGSKVKASSPAWTVGSPLHTALDDYNNGEMCAPHRN